jgi:hypothetical protein
MTFKQSLSFHHGSKYDCRGTTGRQKYRLQKPHLHQQLTFTGLEIIRALCNLAR